MKKSHSTQIKKSLQYLATFVMSIGFAMGISAVFAGHDLTVGGLPPLLHSGPQAQRINTNLFVGDGGATGTATLNVKDFVEFNRVMFVGDREFNAGATEPNLDVANKIRVGMPATSGGVVEDPGSVIDGIQQSGQISNALLGDIAGDSDAKVFIGGNAVVNGLIKNLFLARTTGSNTQLAWESEQEPVCTDPDGFLILCNEVEDVPDPDDLGVNLTISPTFAIAELAINSDPSSSIVWMPIAYAAEGDEAADPIPVQLSWTISGGGASSCSMQQSTNQPVPVGTSSPSSYNSTVTTTTTFTVTCTDDTRSASDSATIALSLYEGPEESGDPFEPYTCISYTQACGDVPTITNLGTDCVSAVQDCPSPDTNNGIYECSGANIPAGSTAGEVMYCGEYSNPNTWSIQ